MTEEQRPYRTRTTVLFAARAPKAVILRRGPRTHYQLILWDTAADTFEPGQWMRGNVRLARRMAIVRVGPFDPLLQRHTQRRPARPKRKIPRYLRPSTRFGSRSPPRELRDGWTAISTPPYFSALAIWPSYGRWTGGGTFCADRDILLRESEDGSTPIENVEIPATVRVNVSLKYFEHRLSAYAPTPTETAEHAALAEALLAAGLLWVDWISLRDDLLFAGDGRIFRLREWRSLPPADLLSAATTLADFRDASFQQLRPPAAAMQW